jgi:hypothetical protein
MESRSLQHQTKNPQTSKFFNRLQIIGIIGITILLVNFGYQLWRQHNARATQALCDIQKTSCTKHLPNNATLALTITPRPIKLNTDLTVSVTITQLHPDAVALFLFPIPATKPATAPIVLQQDNNGIYTGVARLNSTGVANQHWVAMVMLKNGTQQISAPFQFTVP